MLKGEALWGLCLLQLVHGCIWCLKTDGPMRLFLKLSAVSQTNSRSWFFLYHNIIIKCFFHEKVINEGEHYSTAISLLSQLSTAKYDHRKGIEFHHIKAFFSIQGTSSIHQSSENERLVTVFVNLKYKLLCVSEKPKGSVL